MPSSGRDPSLSIIIPNYNGEELLPVFFPSVAAAAANYGGDVEIIVVDDRSTDGSLAVIERLRGDWPALRLVARRANGGFACACNSGLAAARGEIVFFLNTDVELAPDVFAHFAGHFDDPDLFAVTIAGYRYGSGEQIDGAKLLLWRRGFLRVTENLMDADLRASSLRRPYPSYGVQGAYFFARTTMLRALNGFDEIYAPFILEETDLAFRALVRGWRIVYEPRCRGYHQVGSSLRSAARQQQLDIVAARNRLLFTWKNIHSPGLLVSHFLFLKLRLLSLNPIAWSALRAALPRLAPAREGRRAERRECRRTDREILRQSRSLQANCQRNLD